MTRPIIFRAKAVSSGQWVYGNLIHSKRFAGCSNEWRIHNQDTGLESDIWPETIGQFTGLMDRDGKQIFEGDLLKVSTFQRAFIVFFEDGLFQVKVVNTGLWGNLKRLFEVVIKFQIQNPLIIGNIHDNPNLI